MRRRLASLALACLALLLPACSTYAAGEPAAVRHAGASLNDADVSALDRRVMRSADLRLDVDDVDAAGNEVVRLTAAAGGFVLSSSRTWYQVKVPAQALDASLATFEQLGDVTHRALTGEDVTAEYVDLEVRLKNAHAARDSYAQLLQKAENVEEVLQVEQALREVQERIELLEGRRKFLDEHLALSDVTITLRERRTPGPLQILWNAIVWPLEKLWWW